MATIEVRSEEDIVRLGTDYAFRILEIQKQIAEAQADIKVIKTDAKLDGVPVGLVNKALNRIKKELKQTEADKFEEEAWYEAMKENTDIEDKLAEIINI
jgi:hypothetical protein